MFWKGPSPYLPVLFSLVLSCFYNEGWMTYEILNFGDSAFLLLFSLVGRFFFFSLFYLVVLFVLSFSLFGIV